MHTAVRASEYNDLEWLVRNMSLNQKYDEFGNPIGSNKP
jgi:hypothetical protein